VASAFLIAAATVRVKAQASGPALSDLALAVRTAATGFTTPIGIAFIDANEWFVIEKNTGQVQLVVDGTVQSTVLDLAVNNFSERGLS
jgi:hypothetical protein